MLDGRESNRNDETMSDLAEAALAQPARLFTIYGVLNEIEGVVEESPFVGWGMELGDGDGALYWDPDDNSTHRAASAEQVLQFHQRIGRARLAWLDRS
jgi:hypothetical protein